MSYTGKRRRRGATPSKPALPCNPCNALVGGGSGGSAGAATGPQRQLFLVSRRFSPTPATGESCHSRTAYAHGCRCCWYASVGDAHSKNNCDVNRWRKKEMISPVYVVLQEQQSLSRSCRSAVRSYGAVKQGNCIDRGGNSRRAEIHVVCASATKQRRVTSSAFLFLSSAKVNLRNGKGTPQASVKPRRELLLVAGVVAPTRSFKSQASELCCFTLPPPPVHLRSHVARPAPGKEAGLAAQRAASEAAATSSDAAARKATAAAVGRVLTKTKERAGPAVALDKQSPLRFFQPATCVGAAATATVTEATAGGEPTTTDDAPTGPPHVRPYFLLLQRPLLPQSRLVVRSTQAKEAAVATVNQYVRAGTLPASGREIVCAACVSPAACVALSEVPASAAVLSTANYFAFSVAGIAAHETAAEAATEGQAAPAEAVTTAKEAEAGEGPAIGAATSKTHTSQATGAATGASLRVVFPPRWCSAPPCPIYTATAGPMCAGGHVPLESSLSGLARQWLRRCWVSTARTRALIFPSFLLPPSLVSASDSLTSLSLCSLPHRASLGSNAGAPRPWLHGTVPLHDARRETHTTRIRSSCFEKHDRLYIVAGGLDLSPTAVPSQFPVRFPFFSPHAGDSGVRFSTVQRTESRTGSRRGDWVHAETPPVIASGGRGNSKPTGRGDNEQGSVESSGGRCSGSINNNVGNKKVVAIRSIGCTEKSCSSQNEASVGALSISATLIGCSSVPVTERHVSAVQQLYGEQDGNLVEKNTTCNNTRQQAAAAIVGAAASLPLVIAEARGRAAKKRTATGGSNTVKHCEPSVLVTKASAAPHQNGRFHRTEAGGAADGRAGTGIEAALARDATAVAVRTAEVNLSPAGAAVRDLKGTLTATVQLKKRAADVSAPRGARMAIFAAERTPVETSVLPAPMRVIDTGLAGPALGSKENGVTAAFAPGCATVRADKKMPRMLTAATRTSGTNADPCCAGTNTQRDAPVLAGYTRSDPRRVPARAATRASCPATEVAARACAAGDRGAAPLATPVTTATAAVAAGAAAEWRTVTPATGDDYKGGNMLFLPADGRVLTARRQNGGAAAATGVSQEADAGEALGGSVGAAAVAAAEALTVVTHKSSHRNDARVAVADGCGVSQVGTSPAAVSQACGTNTAEARTVATTEGSAAAATRGRYKGAGSICKRCKTAGPPTGASLQTCHAAAAPQMSVAAQHRGTVRQPKGATPQQNVAAGAERRTAKEKSSRSNCLLLHKTRQPSGSGKNSVQRTRKCASAAACSSAGDQGRRVLAIIDGSCLAFRSHYGMPEVLDSSGIPVQAILGFFRSLSGIKKALLQPSHLVVVFDSSSSRTSRLAIYDGYKGHRNETPPTLQQQFLVIMRLCHALGICTLSEDGVEADDVIASLVNRACVASRRAAAAAEVEAHAATAGAESTPGAAAVSSIRASGPSGAVRTAVKLPVNAEAVSGHGSQYSGHGPLSLRRSSCRDGVATCAEGGTRSSASLSERENHPCKNDPGFPCAADALPKRRNNDILLRKTQGSVGGGVHTDDIFDEIVVVTTDKDLLQVLQYNYMEDMQDVDACLTRYDWEAYSFTKSGIAPSWGNNTRDAAVSCEADMARQYYFPGALKWKGAVDSLPLDESTPAENVSTDATSCIFRPATADAFPTKEDKGIHVRDVEGKGAGEDRMERREIPSNVSHEVRKFYEGGGDERAGQSYGIANDKEHGCMGGQVGAKRGQRSNGLRRPHQGRSEEKPEQKEEQRETEKTGKQTVSPGVTASSLTVGFRRIKGPYVRIMQLHRKLRMVDENWVLLHYGVLPHQLRDYLALVGDASDSIRGCEGVGAVTARKLINHANGRLKDLLSDEQRLSRLVNRNQLRSLLKFAPLLERNRHLISLDSNVESVQSFSFSQFVARSTRSTNASKRVVAAAGNRKRKNTQVLKRAQGAPFVNSDAVDAQGTRDHRYRGSVGFPVEEFFSGFLRTRSRRAVRPWHVTRQHFRSSQGR